MALLERLAILITADAAGAINEMKKVAGEAEKNLGKAGDSGSKLSTNMTKVGAAMMGAGAGLLAFGISAASSTDNLGRAVMKLQRYTGASAEEASRLNGAARLAGVSADTLALGLGRLSKAAEANSPAFDKLGIATHNADGSIRPMGDLLPDVAEKFKAMGPGAERTALALQLFGRNGMDLMPFLQRGRDGIADLSKEAEKMGLVLSGDNIAQIKAHIVAQRELSATFEGLRTKVGLQMMPILTGFTDVVKGIPGPVLDVIGPLTVFGGLGLTAAGGIGLIVGQFSNLKTAALGATGMVKNLLTQVQSVPLSFGIAAGAVAILAVGIYAYQQKMNDAAAAGRRALGDLSALNTDQLKQKLADVEEQIKKLKAVNEGSGSERLWRWATGKDEDLQRAKAQKTALEDAIATSSSAQGPIMTLADAQQAAADATDNHTAAIKNLNDTMNASLDPFTNTITATDKNAEAQRKLTEANVKAFYAQNVYNDAVARFGPDSIEARRALDDLGQAQRDVDSAQGSAFRSALDYEQSLATLKAQIKDHPELYKQNIDKINEMERSGKINAETAARMRNRLNEVVAAAGMIPPHAGVSVWADTEEAKRKLNEIHGIIADLLGLDNTLNGTYGRGLGIQVVRPPGKAVGGPISAGMPYLVGELGPELVIPSTSGTVIPADKTAQMLGGGDVNVYVNQPGASAYDIGRELAWTLKVAH